MDSPWKTFGHNSVKNILNKQLAAGIFPHAYLFAGLEGVGKKSLALELAQKILGTSQLNQHPDFRMLSGAGQIPVESIREFIANLNLKPFLARKKVAIIDNAQGLNQQSSNALLKTLEEPSDNTILILISSGRQLLPTIVSRCQVLNFNPFTLNQLREFVVSAGWQADQKLVELSFGSIARLEKLMKDKNSYQELAANISRFEKLQSEKPSERLLAIEDFAELESDELEETLTDWYYWQARDLQDKPFKFKILSALNNALQQLKTNKNKKLILQGLFLKI